MEIKVNLADERGWCSEAEKKHREKHVCFWRGVWYLKVPDKWQLKVWKLKRYMSFLLSREPAEEKPCLLPPLCTELSITQQTSLWFYHWQLITSVFKLPCQLQSQHFLGTALLPQASLDFPLLVGKSPRTVWHPAHPSPDCRRTVWLPSWDPGWSFPCPPSGVWPQWQEWPPGVG